MMGNSDKRKLTAEGASQYLLEQHGVRLTKQTLDAMRSKGGGPAWRRVGRRAYYTRDDLDVFAQGTPMNTPEHAA